MKRFKTLFYSAGVLAISIAGAFLLSLGYSYLSGDTKPGEPPPAQFPVLSDSLRSEMDAAGVQALPFDFVGARDPMEDRAGLGGQAEKADVPQIAAQKAVPQAQIIASSRTPFPRQADFAKMGMPAGPEIKQPVTVQAPADDTAELLNERSRKAQMGGEVGPVSSVYRVDDVRPIGVVGSGSRNEILFYSPKTKQTFAVPRGGKFRDGVLVGIDDEGVRFEKDSAGKEPSRAKWMNNSEKKAVDGIIRVERKPEQASGDVEKKKKPEISRNDGEIPQEENE